MPFLKIFIPMLSILRDDQDFTLLPVPSPEQMRFLSVVPPIETIRFGPAEMNFTRVHSYAEIPFESWKNAIFPDQMEKLCAKVQEGLLEDLGNVADDSLMSCVLEETTDPGRSQKAGPLIKELLTMNTDDHEHYSIVVSPEPEGGTEFVVKQFSTFPHQINIVEIRNCPPERLFIFDKRKCKLSLWPRTRVIREVSHRSPEIRVRATLRANLIFPKPRFWSN